MRKVAKTIFVDDNEYLIWGFHFFNTENRMAEFGVEMDSLLNRTTYKLSYIDDLPMVAEDEKSYSPK